MSAVDWRDFAELDGVLTMPKPMIPTINIASAAKVNFELFINNTSVRKITPTLTITDAQKFGNSLPEKTNSEGGRPVAAAIDHASLSTI